MMDHDIREAVLHLDPLRSVVKTELIRKDGTHEVKHIPGDALADELKAHTHIAPMHTGLLPPGVAMLTAYPDVWDVTLENVTDRCTVYYHKTAYPDFTLPHLLLRCKAKNGVLTAEMSRQNMANETGFSIKTVSRAIRTLVEEDLITKNDKQIRISYEQYLRLKQMVEEIVAPATDEQDRYK